MNNESIIRGLSVQSAVIGSQKKNPLIKEMMEYYESNHFAKEDGSLNYEYLAPDLMAKKLERHGFLYKNETYPLADGLGMIYSTDYFASGVNFQNKNNYAVHCYTSSWQDAGLVKSTVRRLKWFVKLLKL